MNSKNDEKIDFEIPQELSGLFHKHFDKMIIDNSLTNVEVLILSIYLIEHKKQESGVSYEKCKKLFDYFGRKVDSFGKAIYDAKAKSYIQEKDKILYFLSDGLAKLNEITGRIGESPVYIFKSGENFSSIKKFEEFLLINIDCQDIILCDSYISTETLMPFTVLMDKIKDLKILTTSIFDATKFNSYLKKLKKEFEITIEVKINNKIHDRYIICNNKCWTIGSSIKDLGNKDTVIKEISEVVKSMKLLFSERWNEV